MAIHHMLFFLKKKKTDHMLIFLQSESFVASELHRFWYSTSPSGAFGNT